MTFSTHALGFKTTKPWSVPDYFADYFAESKFAASADSAILAQRRQPKSPNETDKAVSLAGGTPLV
jgi:hypothetical protein